MEEIKLFPTKKEKNSHVLRYDVLHKIETLLLEKSVEKSFSGDGKNQLKVLRLILPSRYYII